MLGVGAVFFSGVLRCNQPLALVGKFVQGECLGFLFGLTNVAVYGKAMAGSTVAIAEGNAVCPVGVVAPAQGDVVHMGKVSVGADLYLLNIVPCRLGKPTVVTKFYFVESEDLAVAVFVDVQYLMAYPFAHAQKVV